MSHLIDPCLRATKIAHGIRRGIDGLSPMSGLVPELRILIQEQKNVFTSMKRAAFEKDEAAKHLAIYAKTEGPDIADTLSKLSILIQKSADVERAYSDSVGQSREYFKEIRAAEDENYSVRKRKLDLEQKLALEKAHHHSSTASVASDKASSARGPELHPELHPELKVFRQETMLVENDLEDAKRKKIKQATLEQLEALERWGKEMVVIAHYGRQVMAELDDTPTPAGIYVDDRHATYDGTDKFSLTWKKKVPRLQKH
ncbi:MAG: Eisosome component PIL1/LSP1 [Benniella sp.]|nr:MAG: Eisosome component PIL1/LSP1 [Benniella sp.]